jgi:sigma-B regulation protein RsbU (phosphoserine phosphatase)
VPFEKGDTLIMYTDGLVEAMNYDEEEFELYRLKNILEENPSASSNRLKKEIITRVNDHIGTNPLSDDFTLLISRKIE